ncbi:hypothetical protein EDC56_3513 [Sinobacterium caligoides]|uniref:Uncharacterized protein n=1 Tax=Sinobacterium caligoides TaxID=933926 RepID=A0A3N2DHC2_9GAMM|nr:hypothetical protein [Sinobacterium caligoides]ROR98774.1 hypothetical protein EDC56_3513 [Sinobacterium caligoides]
MRVVKFLQSLAPAHKLATLVTSTAVLIFAINFALWQQQFSAQHLRQQDQYGNQLASQTAYTASNLMLSDSRIGLRVLAAETLKRSQALHVSIYDANNTVVAEAGEERSEHSYRASILLQDNIVGYIDIEFAPQPPQLPNFWFWLCNGLILVAIYLASYLGARKFTSAIDSIFASLRDSKRFDIQKELPRTLLTSQFIDSQKDNSNNLVDGEGTPTLLAIRFTNSRGEPIQLQQEDDCQLLLDNMAIIDKVAKLYDGQHHSGHEGEVLSFNHSTDACFQALCAAVLIRSLFEQSSNPDDHSDIALALTTAPAAEAIPTELDTQYRQQFEGELLAKANQLGEIVLSRLLLAEPTIAERTRVNSGHNDIYTLLSVSPVYQKLLDNQLGQLTRADEQPE